MLWYFFGGMGWFHHQGIPFPKHNIYPGCWFGTWLSFVHSVGKFVIPTDGFSYIFFRGVGRYTKHQAAINMSWASFSTSHIPSKRYPPCIPPSQPHPLVLSPSSVQAAPGGRAEPAQHGAAAVTGDLGGSVGGTQSEGDSSHGRSYRSDTNWLVVTGTWLLYYHILGISSSQLTFIFFRGVETTNQLKIRWISWWILRKP